MKISRRTFLDRAAIATVAGTTLTQLQAAPGKKGSPAGEKPIIISTGPFGKASNEYMLPDCFGFPASLPTILAHAGLKGFSTQKLSAHWVPAPMVGGLMSSAFLTLELIPVVYTYWRYAQLKRALRDIMATTATRVSLEAAALDLPTKNVLLQMAGV